MEIVIDGPTLVFSGDFDVRSTWMARSVIYDHLATVEGDVVLDFSEVDNADLTALKLLAVATRQARAEGRHLILQGCTPAVRRMLHLSRLYRVLDVERSPLIA
ncbi:anti-anti-sigma factor [Nocardioides luteus]|uniref:STAS domain-containing protein n=1 Tax=Nocardioides luteus TaxID=1844 RepID=A0ABQ5SWV4_9ACTN|nr:STAS domain-containing protein [Nocardioides luteus]MDR7311741.1 anti-anti-sigma factor [Nocardioides luteus]GGR66268.1 hypothetical protein GCM10010197_37290 [Nocardioides luteus]GLJ67982.1 hypothetical protein GCM10017579_20180 [Nocardioides luteus]